MSKPPRPPPINEITAWMVQSGALAFVETNVFLMVCLLFPSNLSARSPVSEVNVSSRPCQRSLSHANAHSESESLRRTSVSDQLTHTTNLSAFIHSSLRPGSAALAEAFAFTPRRSGSMLFALASCVPDKFQYVSLRARVAGVV